MWRRWSKTTALKIEFEIVRGQIQEYEVVPCIWLLDEPGMHLHATAQCNLSDFLKDLSEKYHIIYTTHFPYMSDKNMGNIYNVINGDFGTRGVNLGRQKKIKNLVKT